MQKIWLFILTFGVFVFNMTNVTAVCDFNETNKLNNLATNVKVSYELIEEELKEGEYTPPDGLPDEEEANFKPTYYSFQIYIENITEDLYVEVYNDATKESIKYTYEDSKNGTITFLWTNVRIITNFTINIYSSNNTNCANTKLFTNYLTTPRYNEYSEYDLCKGNEDFYLCYEWLSVSGESFDEFVSLVEKYENGKISDSGEVIKDPQKDEKGIINFIKKNKGVIIGATTGIVALGGLVTVILVKKKRGRIV